MPEVWGSISLTLLIPLGAVLLSIFIVWPHYLLYRFRTHLYVHHHETYRRVCSQDGTPPALLTKGPDSDERGFIHKSVSALGDAELVRLAMRYRHGELRVVMAFVVPAGLIVIFGILILIVWFFLR